MVRLFQAGDSRSETNDAELDDAASVRAIVGALERARLAKEKTVLAGLSRPIGFEQDDGPRGPTARYVDDAGD